MSSSKIPLKIGLTGGIGSGKSTVCKVLKSLSIPIFKSDNIAKEIYDELHGLTNTVLISDGTRIVKVVAQNTPIDIGRDDNLRHEWTVNLQIEVRNISTNRS